MLTIEILSGAGGVGKTTLALCLAAYWNKDGAKVALLDLDESKQLTDAYDLKTVGYDLVKYIPEDEYDILIIDNPPGTKTATNNADVVLYPMLPHRKSIRALKRTLRILPENNVVFVANKCDFRKTSHQENAALIRSVYDGLEVRENTLYEKVMETGGNFLDFKKDNNYYKAKTAIALIAQRIEGFL